MLVVTWRWWWWWLVTKSMTITLEANKIYIKATSQPNCLAAVFYPSFFPSTLPPCSDFHPHFHLARTHTHFNDTWLVCVSDDATCCRKYFSRLKYFYTITISIIIIIPFYCYSFHMIFTTTALMWYSHQQTDAVVTWLLVDYHLAGSLLGFGSGYGIARF